MKNEPTKFIFIFFMKASAANVLLGRDKNYDGTGFSDGCFQTSSQHVETVTRSTCPDSGHFLGDPNNPELTVIDTPGKPSLYNKNFCIK